MSRELFPLSRDLLRTKSRLNRHKSRLNRSVGSAEAAEVDRVRLGGRLDVELLVEVGERRLTRVVAAGLHPSPITHADFVTTTTHKTLRGPRGGLILCREADKPEIDKKLFPGVQGGPLVHIGTGRALGIVSRLCAGTCSEEGPTVQGILAKAASRGFSVTLRTV